MRPPLDALSALDPSFDASQPVPVISDGCIGGGQQQSQLCLSQQVALDLPDQPLELGAICNGHGINIPVLVSVRCSELHSIAPDSFKSTTRLLRSYFGQLAFRSGLMMD